MGSGARRAAAALAACLLAARAAADHDARARGAGGVSAEFLTIAVGARGVGLGEAYSAVVDDASALHWNPAALTRVKRFSAALMRNEYWGAGSFQHGSLAGRLDERAVGALGATYTSPGRVEETGEDSLPTGGVVRPYDLAVVAAYARRLGEAADGFSLGASAKLVRSKLVDSVSTVAADAGMLSPAFLGERVRVAAVASNLGQGLRYGSEREDLPLRGRVGASLMLSERWLLAADGVMPRGESAYFGAGTEYAFARGEGLRLVGRAGYNRRADHGDALEAVVFGAGLGWDGVMADYAVIPREPGNGAAHRISLTLSF